MDKTKVDVTLDKGVKELVIREGKALDLLLPEQVKLTGIITSAQDYWKKRSGYQKKEECYVVFSKDKLFLALVCDEKNKLGARVEGSIKPNPELETLGINQDKSYNLQQLRDKLKFMRSYFKDVDSYADLMGNLAKFTATIQGQIEKETSERGNKKDNFEVKVDTSLSLDFVLSMPLFKGTFKVAFKVDICFDVRDKNIEMWLESVELRDLQIEHSEKMIGQQVLYFEEQGLVVIEV